MKPKKKKAGKPNLPKDFGTVLGKDDVPRMILAGEAFMGAIERARMNLYGIPRELIRQAMVQLYDGRPLVFASKGNDFIICDPRTYAQMVKNTG